MDLIKLFDRFDTDDKCRDYLESLRWPAGVACTRCGDMDVSPIKAQWHCIGCGFQRESGTIVAPASGSGSPQSTCSASPRKA